MGGGVLGIILWFSDLLRVFWRALFLGVLESPER